MRQRRRSTLAGWLEAGEGFIDVLFLLLTFFIVQNVWQVHLANLHSRFVHAQKLNFVKAPDETNLAHPPDEKFIKIIIGKEFIQFDKGGIVAEERYAFKSSPDIDQTGIERAIFQATQNALGEILAQRGYTPKDAPDITVLLYFERDATVTYTVGVYDALNRTGFKTVQWGLESQKKRF